jgi:hypothetical protein
MTTERSKIPKSQCSNVPEKIRLHLAQDDTQIREAFQIFKLLEAWETFILTSGVHIITGGSRFDAVCLGFID